MADQAAIIRMTKLRLTEASRFLTRAAGFDVPLPCEVSFGEYEHFKKKRGFGVTFSSPGKPCHIMLSDKLTREELWRVDAIIRHEIGHVVDMTYPANALNPLALNFGFTLPPAEHAELRADAIAEWLWGQKLFYDHEDVQSTRHGTYPRPSHLGR